MNKSPVIFGIGNPLIDIVILVSDNDIISLGLNKGTMELVELKQQKEILQYFKDSKLKFCPGGSAPNTIIACAGLGISSMISGKIGAVKFGDTYLRQVENYGVLSSLIQDGSGSTGTSVILVTPDGERTMVTNLGICREYLSGDIDKAELIKSSFLYFTGYMWDTISQKKAIRAAIEIAKENKIIIAFDVADPFAVQRNKVEFLDIIKNDIDIVFANEVELSLLFDSNDTHKSIDQLMEYVKSGGIKLGKKGSMVFEGGEKYKIKPRSVKSKDTTGAGDMYAAGFLSSLSRCDDYKLAGELGVALAEEIIQIQGAQFDKNVIDKLASKMFQ